jgi:hypothetical protein
MQSQARVIGTTTRGVLSVAGAAALAIGLLGGCETAVTSAPPSAPSAATAPRVVNYPNGRYELRGEGTAANPLYWVWVPATSPAVVPAPATDAFVVPSPPVAPSAAVTGSAERVRAYPGGQYHLLGDGTPAAPYYWVWVPAGTQPPPPPPVPRR